MRRGRSFWPIALGLYGAIGGGISLAAWIFDAPRLADWFGTGISIQPNTAANTIAVGIALIALANGRIAATRGLAIFAGFTGAAAIFQTYSGIMLGPLDTALRFGREWGGSATIAPGRMGMPSAFSWVLMTIALFLATSTKLADKIRCTGPAAAGLATVVATSSLLGYLFGASALYAIPSATAIALQTATFVLALSVGVILSEPKFGPGRLIFDPGVAGTMFRRVLPALVVVPVVLGYARLQGERLGYYDLAFGTAMRTVVEMAILTFFVWLAALDISKVEKERTRFQNQLAENESLLRTVTEEAEVGLVIIDRDHRYLYANRSYAEIILADPVSIVGKKVEEVLPEVYDWRVRPKIERAFAGETVKYELDLPKVGRFVSVTYQPVLTDVQDGQITRVIVAIVDTTHRRQIENALEKSRADLELAAKRKDEFLMTLAHELRNPLAPIRTAVDIIKRTEPGDDLTQPRDVIDRQLKLMVRLLDDLLDVGRIERDTLALRKERVDLANVIRNAVEISQPLADRFGQQITAHPPAEPIEVNADPARLEQVVANLLNNACRFTPPGGRIDVRVERDGPDALVRVRDNGVGIAADDLSRIFEMFAQLEQTDERAQGGLGIGLHLVKRLVEMHGGRVEATSAGISHGSEFVVRLPALVSTGVHRPTIAKATDDHKAVGRPPVSPRRVLVVDDNIDAAMALSMLLNIIGHETHLAHTGPEALESATALQPDVVLLDLGLPGMNGFEVCEQIRKTFGEKQPLVVALTGWGQESDRRKSRESGFDHHLVKPVDYDALAELLAKPAR